MGRDIRERDGVVRELGAEGQVRVGDINNTTTGKRMALRIKGYKQNNYM
jgi:hypothetical protein